MIDKNNNINNTITFLINNNFSKEKLTKIYNALLEKNYDPVNQIAGYILSGDPTYITTYKDARKLIQEIDRFELLKKLIKNYIK